MKKQSGKKSGLSFDIGALIIFLLVFLIGTGIFTVVKLGTTEDVYVETKTEDGEVIREVKQQAALIFETNEADERLSRDMTPIAVDESSPFYEAIQTQDRVNVLLLGLADGMTDTIMVASYNMDDQTVSIISIPRDTYCQRANYKSYAENKINCKYRLDGAVGIATAVSNILYGMPIHYYVIVEYDDVRAIMDAIGGVEVDIPFHMKYDDNTPGKELHIDIPQGLQTIDSSNVVEFLRFRHSNSGSGYKSYKNGDIGRTEVQRDFVKKVIKKCLTAGNLLDVVKCAMENIESDITYVTAVKVAKKAIKGLDAENVQMYAMPGTDQMIKDLSFWVNDEKGIFTMLKKVYGIPEEENSEKVSQ